MKTLIDVVKELKGDLNNLKLGLHPKHKVIIDMSRVYGGLVGTAYGVGEETPAICSIEDFNQAVIEMSEGIY